MRYRVRAHFRETHDVVTVVLDPAEEPVPVPRPGQFCMLWLPGVGESAISLSGRSHPDEPLVHTVRAVGPVTAALCALGVGDEVGVRGPFGRDFGLDDPDLDGADLAIVAGGLGLAPLRPVLYRVLDERDRFGEVTLLVGARAPEELLYPDELERWSRSGAVAVFQTVDRAWPNWPHEVGVVTQLVPLLRGRVDRTWAFVCGPELMMRYAARSLVGRGIRPERVLVSLERNMQCGFGLCGHCQLGPFFVCHDGPVLEWSRVESLMAVRER